VLTRPRVLAASSPADGARLAERHPLPAYADVTARGLIANERLSRAHVPKLRGWRGRLARSRRLSAGRGCPLTCVPWRGSRMAKAKARCQRSPSSGATGVGQAKPPGSAHAELFRGMVSHPAGR